MIDTKPKAITLAGIKRNPLMQRDYDRLRYRVDRGWADMREQNQFCDYWAMQKAALKACPAYQAILDEATNLDMPIMYESDILHCDREALTKPGSDIVTFLWSVRRHGTDIYRLWINDAEVMKRSRSLDAITYERDYLQAVMSVHAGEVLHFRQWDGQQLTAIDQHEAVRLMDAEIARRLDVD